MQKVMKVCRVTSGARDPIMKGRILGCSTNKYLRFVADTGSLVAIIPRSVATRLTGGDIVNLGNIATENFSLQAV